MPTEFALERNADDGDPLFTLFLDHQYGFSLIARSGCLATLIERDHGNATGNGLIEQTADKAGFSLQGSTAQQQTEGEQETHDHSG